MIDPLFWLGLSILLVAVSLTAVLVAALPVLQELARAARSAEKLFDTLRRDLPPTLEAIRLTGLEISDLTDDVSDGVKSAGQVVKQVNQSVSGTKKQAKNIELGTRSVFAGVKATWKSLTRRPPSPRRTIERLPAGKRTEMQWREGFVAGEENRVSEAKPEGLASSEAYYTYNTNPEISRQKPRDTSAWQTDREDFDELDSEDFLPNPAREDE